MSDVVTKDELSRVVSKLELTVESKCSSSVFWSSVSVAVVVCITLFSFLFTRQNDIADAVSRMETTFAQAKETSDAHGCLLEKISDAQTESKVFMSVINANLHNLTLSSRAGGQVSSDIAARIARGEIAWAKERAEMKNKN